MARSAALKIAGDRGALSSHANLSAAMRVFTAALATGTNTFSPIPTDLSTFQRAFYVTPGKHPQTPALCSSPRVALRRYAGEEGLTLIEGPAADDLPRRIP